MFPCLGHNAFIGGNNKKHHIDTPCACHHVPYKLFMTWDINNTHEKIIAKAIMCKTKLSGNAPFFFLFETITVNTRQGFNESCFTVINVACCANNNLFHSL